MTQQDAQLATKGPIGTYVALAQVKLIGIWREVAKFGIVGLIALVIDTGISNVLWLSPAFADRPLTAKVISVAAATTFAYFGNRFWTYRDRTRGSMTREYSLFFGLNAVALGIALACMWISTYALGLEGVVANNISANIVGLALGTLFRFWSYRKFVFRDDQISAQTSLELAES